LRPISGANCARTFDSSFLWNQLKFIFRNLSSGEITLLHSPDRIHKW
jgi:hypothetical protein